MTAELCGHGWMQPEYGVCPDRRGGEPHRCTEPADHPTPCRCRCGATTTQPTEGEQ